MSCDLQLKLSIAVAPANDEGGDVVVRVRWSRSEAGEPRAESYDGRYALG